jgi:murein DD-endopeptidase MepM/ murein hydrolase activator NlpD
MQKPFDGNYRLTQGFGENPASYAKFGLKGHNGLDYGLPSKTAVKAPIAGTVKEIAFDATGYGNYVKIENDTEGSILAHLDSTTIGVGEVVQEGTLIGYSDNTGNSTGPHLHWGYYPIPRDRTNGYTGCIDQLPLLNIPVDPPTPEPTQPMRQIIIDAYRAICGVEPTEDELKARLDSGINTYDLIKDIMFNDERSEYVKLKNAQSVTESTASTTTAVVEPSTPSKPSKSLLDWLLHWFR